MLYYIRYYGTKEEFRQLGRYFKNPAVAGSLFCFVQSTQAFGADFFAHTINFFALQIQILFAFCRNFGVASFLRRRWSAPADVAFFRHMLL